MEISTGLPLKEKLHILADAAKYDVACTSSGVDRKGKEGYLGNSVAAGICHSFASDGRCISLLKILFTNHCIYDCKYCINRSSNDVVRTSFTPREVCQLTIEFYKRNYIEGLFLSSGVLRNPAYTMEQLCQTLYLLRTEYRFNGYIHVKAIPGAPDELLAEAGYLADRMSINLELPTGESLHRLAPNKSHRAILCPMRMMTDTIAAHRQAIGKDPRMDRSGSTQRLQSSIFREMPPASGTGLPFSNSQKSPARLISPEGSPSPASPDTKNVSSPTGKDQAKLSGYPCADRNLADSPASSPAGRGLADSPASSPADRGLADSPASSPAGRGLADSPGHCPAPGGLELPSRLRKADLARSFAPAGQSTQIIIGATPETDYQLLCTTQYLYQSYDLKRVFFSAYVPLNEDSTLPPPGTPVPLLREHRLYQADWLLRFYGFSADELLSGERPNFNEQLDPKCDWALRHLDQFPVEVNRASYDQILRIPGIGPKSAARIVQSRRYGSLDFPHLKKMGVVLKRAHYFITCGGRMMYRTPLDEGYITRQLTGINENENWHIAHQGEGSFRQMSLFDDFSLKTDDNGCPSAQCFCAQTSPASHPFSH